MKAHDEQRHYGFIPDIKVSTDLEDITFVSMAKTKELVDMFQFIFMMFCPLMVAPNNQIISSHSLPNNVEEL